MKHTSIVLASRSPRRSELLTKLGVDIEIVPADIDESPFDREDPVVYVERLARSKAQTVAAKFPHRVVLAADTTVDIDGRILGQPVDEADMRRMLRELSGRTHRVHTGVAVVSGESDGRGRIEAVVVTSLVTFHPITETTLDWYIGTGEPWGKAGSYAIQGLGGTLVASTRGSMSNIIGLPLRETARLLGLSVTDLAEDTP